MGLGSGRLPEHVRELTAQVEVTHGLPERLLRPNVLVWLVAALGCATVAVLEYGSHPDRDWTTWFGIVTWSAIAIVVASQLVPGAAYLKLTAESFEVKAFFRRWRCAWRHVEAIRVHAPFGVVRIVMFDLTADANIEVTAPARSRWLPANRGRLPSTYGLAPQALVRLMMRYRDAARRGSAQPSEDLDHQHGTD